MKKHAIILLGILLILTLACSLSPQVDTFENDAFSFGIPKDWMWGGDFEDHFGPAAQQIVGIRNPHGLLPVATFTVVTTPLTGKTSLESRFTQTYEGFDLIKIVSKQEFIQGVLSGYEINYSHIAGESWWEYRDIWLEKDAVIYVLSFRTCCNTYEKYADSFDQILASFRFK